MTPDDVYAFCYRGLLTRTAIRNARQQVGQTQDSVAAITNRFPFELLDTEHVQRAREMAVVYTAIAAFENSVREFIKKRMLEELGEEWWDKGVPDKRRAKAEERRNKENETRWHAKRGDSLLDYTELGDLSAILTTNQAIFQPLLDIEWAKHIFDIVELSRNIIMHSGCLDRVDIDRLGMALRDWLTQIGG